MIASDRLWYAERLMLILGEEAGRFPTELGLVPQPLRAGKVRVRERVTGSDLPVYNRVTSQFSRLCVEMRK